jgi:uncharacterized lipoprotein YddW (UPF0748 family)
MLLALLALACSPPVRKADPGAADTAPDTAVTDTADTATGPETVDVGHRRELRALCVATVYNIDWPSRTGLSAQGQTDEIVALLDLMQRTGFNAAIVQLRPEGDALYRSELEPWSRWLTGTQGTDPGYDPLEVWLREGHARNIEIHGWLNPFRAKVGSESTSGLASSHMARTFPTYAYPYSGDVWMDPGAPEVRARVVQVTQDLVARYDLDGIFFDDYFYPYPDDGDFPDDATWAAYQRGGGSLARDDWRRSNTAAMVRDVSQAIADADATVRFGIAPFGIWRPGYPAGITGFDAYEGLYADPLDWAENGWLDYLMPQLYWETGNSGQEYGLLAAWWDAQLPDTIYHFPANYLSQYGTSSTWTLDEYAAQLAITRDPALTRTQGAGWYSASPLIDDAPGLRDAFATRYYPTPSLPPPVMALAGLVVSPPDVRLEGNVARWPDDDARRATAVYAADGEGWRLDRIVPGSETSVTLPQGRWALTAVAKGDVESRGVRVEVP